MREVLYILLAGGLGALGRYYTTGLAQRLLGEGFPHGTLIVNVLGSFILGFIMQASISTDLVPPSLRIALTIGFLGAFTTFSTFSYETFGFIEDGSWLTAGVNILTNLVPGLIAVFSGVMLGRALFGGA